MVKHDMTCDPLQCQNVPDLFMDFFRSQKKSSVHWSLAPGIQHLGCSLIWPNDMWCTWDICDTRSDQNIHVCWFVEDLFLLEFNVCWFTYVHMVHNPMFFFPEGIRINQNQYPQGCIIHHPIDIIDQSAQLQQQGGDTEVVLLGRKNSSISSHGADTMCIHQRVISAPRWWFQEIEWWWIMKKLKGMKAGYTQQQMAHSEHMRGISNEHADNRIESKLGVKYLAEHRFQSRRG